MCESPFLLPVLELLLLLGTTPSRALWGGTSHAARRVQGGTCILLSARYRRGSELLVVTNSSSRSCSSNALYTGVYYSTLLTASHKQEMFKIEKIIAEKSVSKNYAGVTSSRNWSLTNKSLKRKNVMLCCYENINAHFKISGPSPIFCSNAKSSKHPLSLNYLVIPPF